MIIKQKILVHPVDSVLISLIATAYGAGENVYDFLKDLQKYKKYLKSHPVAWLPWNYKKTIEAIELAAKNAGDEQIKI